MKATITNAAGEVATYKLDRFPFPKKGVQPEGYHLVDQDGNQLLSRVTRSPWGAYTYVMYDETSYSFPRHIELPSGTQVVFSEGTVKSSTTKTVPDSKPIDVEAIIQAAKTTEAAETVEEYYQAQLDTAKDPIEEATKWVNEQETKRGLGQAPTIAEYLPKIQPKNKPPRKAPTK